MAKFLITLVTVFCILKIVTSRSSEEDASAAAASAEGSGTSEEKSEENTSCGCKGEYLNPVCGSNGLTYPSRCLIKCATKRVPGLEVVSEGRCPVARKNKKGRGRPRESLSCFCRKHIKEVCGSDGKIYGNKCLLKCARKKNPDLKKVKLSECSEGGKADGPQGRTYYYSGHNDNYGHNNYGHDYGHGGYGHDYSHEHYG